MVMRSLRDGASGGFMKYILFGILGMSVGGLVVMDVRGVLGGGSVGSNDVLRISDETVDIQDFHRNLTLQLSRYQISPQQAYKIGLVDDVLRTEIRKTLIYKNSKDLDISIGKAQLAKSVAQIVKPQVREGETLQSTLNAVLKSQRISEQDFVKSVEVEASARIITDALQDAYVSDSDLLAGELYKFQRQTRDLNLIVFPDSDIKDIEAPTQEQLLKLYEGLKDHQFKISEYRSAQAALLNPSNIKVTVNVTDPEVKQAYQDNIDKFAIGQQFVITQTILDTQEQADAVYAAIQSGMDLKDAAFDVVKERVKYYESTPFEEELMLPGLLKAVSDGQIGVAKPPVKSPLGYHVVKLDEIIPSGTKSFESVKQALRQELEAIERSDALYDVASEFDELLSDGVALDVIKEKIDFTVLDIPLIDRQGLSLSGDNGLAQFSISDHELIKEILFEVEEGEPSLLQELDSGALMSIILKDRQEESYQPFDAVKDQLQEQFVNDQRNADNNLRLQKYIAELEAGGITIDSLAREQGKNVQSFSSVALFGAIPAPLKDAHRPVIFQGENGGYEIIALEGGFGLVHIADYGYVPEKVSSPAGQGLEDLKQTLIKESSDEVLLTYLRYLQNENDVVINRKLLEGAYGGGEQ